VILNSELEYINTVTPRHASETLSLACHGNSVFVNKAMGIWPAVVKVKELFKDSDSHCYDRGCYFHDTGRSVPVVLIVFSTQDHYGGSNLKGKI